MKALITGASSGLGRDMAVILSKMGYDIIAVARREENLLQLKNELATNVQIITLDLSIESNCFDLFKKVENESIDVFINNAGFGALGEFSDIPLEHELKMIDTNIKAMHILTKLFVSNFKKKNHGHILNVASSAGFMAGPKMATYYATKSYVLNLTLAIYEELRQEKSKVHISVLAPGPVKTEFGQVAKAKFEMNSLNSTQVAEYAINCMFKNKLIIVPSFCMRAMLFGIRFTSRKSLLKIVYAIQSRKEQKN